ncbi:hypothetical protein V6N12_039938 [Hibiscus sabdariffa]|uniref:Uncharacterized protein n=1 Tax=Hibiscus sabdariffa TaxID=183260 RepID=A0ABR2E3Y2_9ROSI
MVKLDVGSANLETGDVIAGGLGSSHFPTLQHPQNVGKKVQDPCAVRSDSTTVVKEWNLFNQPLNFFPPGELDGKILVQPPRERTADKLWGCEGSVVIRFLAPEEKCFRKGVVQTNVGTKDRDALNSSSGTLDIGDGGGSVIYEDNVIQTNVMQPVDQGIKQVEIKDGINPVGAVGFSAAVSNSVVSIESTVYIPCVEVEPVDIIVPVEVPIVNEGLLGSNKFEALVNTAVEHEGVVLSPRKAAGGVAELLNQLKPKPKGLGPGHKKGKGKGKDGQKGGASPSVV